MTSLDRTQLANSSVVSRAQDQGVSSVMDFLGSQGPVVLGQIVQHFRKAETMPFLQTLQHPEVKQSLAQALKPAAVRIERTVGHLPSKSDQTAMTIWFGEGPHLPSAQPDHSEQRSALKSLGLQLAGTLAISAATVALAEWERRRKLTIIDHPISNRALPPATNPPRIRSSKR